MSLLEYIESLNVANHTLENYGLSESIEFKSEVRAGRQAVLNIKVVIIDKSELYIREYITSKYGIEQVSHTYQYQSEDGRLIFRYDNAKHKPALGYDEHKHTRNSSIIPSQLPCIDEIVDEVIGCLS